MLHIYYALADGLFISVFSIIIVFLILLLISIVVHSLKNVHEKVEIKQEPIQEKVFTMEDITDEDMMVAALVASIDYQEITQGNVKVTRIKQTN